MNSPTNLPLSPLPLRCGNHVLAFAHKTYIMGIVNVTPDSFSGDGLAGRPHGAVEQGVRMVEDGADLLDVGGESTRPGSEQVTVQDELRRVIPVIDRLRENVDAPISIDTYKSAVARAAVEAGATMVNDISGLNADPRIADVAAESGAALVLMHMQGTPQTMQQNPHYDDVIGEIAGSLSCSVERATQAGMPRSQIAIDPGIGFGKTVEHNLEIIRRLSEFRDLGCAILIGASRKSFIGKILDVPVDHRLEGTAASVALSIANGANIVRVHDVKGMSRIARMCDAILGRLG